MHVGANMKDQNRAATHSTCIRRMQTMGTNVTAQVEQSNSTGLEADNAPGSTGGGLWLLVVAGGSWRFLAGHGH